MRVNEDIVLIAGPTASGKTRLAIEVAQANNGAIINTDSMQVYADLRIITARPDEEEERAAPHHLFGCVDAANHYSVARWIEDVRGLVDDLRGEFESLVFVGGTGLYFTSMLEGLSPVPQIASDIREKWRNAERATLYSALQELDPRVAENLEPSDSQRIIRALEVIESTGKSLLEWQQEKGEPIFSNDASILKLLKMPDRSLLHERINQRFDLMIEQGAVEEVEKLLARELDPTLPCMKAIGVPQIAAALRGDIDFAQAIEKSKAASRQYAKRQSTWFRNTFDAGWQEIGG